MTLAEPLSRGLREAGRRVGLALLCLVSIAAGQPWEARAGAPAGITFQGLALDPAGAPLDGTRDLVLRIFDDPLSTAAGDQVYQESHLATPLVDGVFSVVIGTGSSPSGPFGAAIFSVPDLWLEVVIAGEVLAPRTKLQSVAFALQSANADTAANATNAANAVNATTALNATSATNSVNATNASNATNAATAQNALQLGGVAASQYVQTGDPRLSDARPPTAGSASYIQNTTVQQAASDFNVSGNGTTGGTLTGNVVSATTQYNIGISRVLASPGSFNFFAGNGAGQLTTTGTGDSFFGVNAGIFNTSGSNNAFFGFEAGRNTNTGGSNAFFGKDAGRSNNTGADNAFFGSDAGQTSTTGVDNAFFGSDAGQSSTTASGNSFFGARAGSSNTTGANSAFFGFEAGMENEDAFNNSFFGYSAGRDNVIGLNNSFFGFDAGVVNTGSRNSFFGSGAGQTSTGGFHNSFFGGQAGGFNTTGDDNSFFGLDAGVTNTTGSFNTVIGSVANVGSGALTNATAIGANALVEEDNALILGSINGVNGATANVQVGIGTTTPQARLHVNGIIRVETLGAAGSTDLCRNASNQIATCSSSLRYKTNLSPFTDGLALIARLQPISFDWKAGGPRDLGLGAEAVAEVEPLLVTRNDQGEVEGVKYDRLGVVLVNAVKDQQSQLESQQALIRDQQAQIDQLKRSLCTLQPELEGCARPR